MLRKWHYVLLAMIFLAGCRGMEVKEKAEKPERIRILVYAEGWRYGPAGVDIARSIQEAPERDFAVQFANTEWCLEKSVLSNYDVLVLYNHNNILPVHEENVVDFVKRGGGLVALHHVISASNRNPILTHLIGADYRTRDGGIGHRDYNIIVLDKEHPIAEGVAEKFLVQEDQDWQNKFFPGVEVHHIFTNDVADNGDQLDVGWTREFGRGLIFYFSPGDPIHLRPYNENENLRKVLLNAARWVAKR